MRITPQTVRLYLYMEGSPGQKMCIAFNYVFQFPQDEEIEV
jgi:hypothetical protein